jgi:EAL domain-containing protein (putative c-di-GMP-specific phosphodiesterase class I)
MNTLRAAGCRFSLDDFGSGMSSFAYLKTLPVDSIKIDGGFVRDMLTDAVDFAMVEAITRIGHVRGLATIAEYVENEEIARRLTVLGVDYAQGYGLHRPQSLVVDAPVAENSPS